MIAPNPYDFLRSDQGRALLAALEGFDEAHATAAAERARAIATPEVSAAALATVFARRRASASGKFERPDLMLFTRAGFEQASSSAVARHRGARFAGLDRVYDLCCGIGADTAALAAAARKVIGVDVDADALGCAAHNVGALAVGSSVKFVCDDALRVPLEKVSAVFADPSRRGGGERARDGDAYLPPLPALLARASEIPGSRLCVKVAPGLDFDARPLRDALQCALEVEVVSERGVCKEAVFWCGDLAREDGARRATVIDRVGAHVLDGDPVLAPDVGTVGSFIGEPDPAVIRAKLIGVLCAAQGARVLDERVAYLTSEFAAPGPFARWFRVRDAMAFGVKRLRAYLRERSVGELIVKTRAFPLRPPEVVALLKPRGSERAVLICTTIGEKKTVIVCDPL
jgi:SAM-dependent methyltransferase